ncbi:PH domain-containing protein [Mesobacillus maritimus]|uniref:PH domain-containing protein n=1 Tax=Mesobacillus maritimus TaxID=1643336 RepID=UPI00203B9B2B|nr:PH domain-containing protein [Mesobacillus maritimus]MCM3584644.1 PH domain-containing protein [Mesobacillus maritimus]MCM3671378.1 PH domain-containing protein [Mesobacillus maritimus]
MLKKLASDALGLSDIGKIIEPQDYDKTDADDYVRHEDNEKIYFLIKTKADEYCFTNLAIIHVDGENAVSSKRTLKRYPYSHYKISNVLLETAGRVDLDIEIKFQLGNENLSIDVDKKQIDKLNDLYKALVYISEVTRENDTMLELANQSLDKAVTVLHNARTNETQLADQYKQLTEFGFQWLESAFHQYHQKDFGEVYEKYINN